MLHQNQSCVLSPIKDRVEQPPIRSSIFTVEDQPLYNFAKVNEMERWINGKKRIAVLFGGQSTEHEVSLRSSITVIKSIDRTEYELTLIGVDKQGRWALCDETDYLINPDDPHRIKLVPTKRYLAVMPGHTDGQLIDTTSGQALAPIDIAFSLLHGGAGENGSIQGLLQVLNIPFVGSDVLGSAICMDKDMTKRVLRDAGLPVTPWVTLLRTSTSEPDFETISAELGLPLFIKPASQGSSIGVSKVYDKPGFQKGLALAFTFDHKVLVETAITGREIETSVIGNDHPEASACGEVIVKDEYYSYDNKYVSGSLAELVVPAPLGLNVSDEIRRICCEAYRVLGCAVMSRVDVFYTQQGEIIINEINTLPGFTANGSVFPRLWASSGIDSSQLVSKLLSLTLERAREMGEIKIDR